MARGYAEAPGWLQEIIAASWPPDEWDHAALVADCESRWWPGAWNQSGEDSRGLWQLNLAAGNRRDRWAGLDLFDPWVNGQLAAQLWASSGWQPWTCARLLGIPDGGGNGGNGGLPVPIPIEGAGGILLVIGGVALLIYLLRGR